ncbi:MAG TPA: sulfatase [Planctomycetota bacterium]|nr:sulfatase [Planctomycetota bacterium]
MRLFHACRGGVLPNSLLLTALLGPWMAGCGGGAEPGSLRHVLLVSLDTARADRIGAFGDQAARTPALDGLSERGVSFDSVTSAAPTTLASHTSLMTGSWPHTHGVARNGFVVHEDNQMLAELFRQEGFHTAGVLGSFALESRFRFDQGFDHYDESFDLLVSPAGADQNQRRGDRVTRAALQHVDRVMDDVDRLFMFVHYFDTHAPYAPPEPFAKPFLAPGASATSDMRLVDEAVCAQQQAVTGQAFGHAGAINAGLRGPLRALVGNVSGRPGPVDAHLAALYAGEMSFMDKALGDLLDGLGERGILDETLVILVADHGETFWEHADLWNHGLAVYQTTVHVPLLFCFPDGRQAGQRVSTPVSTIDVVPTLCELLGLALPPRCEGVSLVSALEGATLKRGPVFSEATQPWVAERPGVWANAGKARCVRDGRWKYVASPYNQVEELFDLEADPGERVNLLGSDPSAQILATRNGLRSQLMSWQEGRDPLPARFDSSQMQETLQRLKAMGYSGESDSSGD